MSTNINITVKGNSLVDQAKAQQQAARQAQLEKENRTRLEREASAQRTAAQTTQGRDATGAPTSSPALRSNFQPDEPAANRSIALGFGEAFYKIEQNFNAAGEIRLTVWAGNGVTSTTEIVENSGIPAGYRNDAEKYAGLPPVATNITTEILVDNPPPTDDITRRTQVTTTWFTVIENSTTLTGEYNTVRDNLIFNNLGIKAQGGVIDEVILLPLRKDTAILSFIGHVHCYKSVGSLTTTEVYANTTPSQYSFSYTFGPVLSESTELVLTSSFLVTKTSVKKITTPSNLISTLESSKYWRQRKSAPIQYSFSTTYDPYAPGYGNETINGLFDVYGGVREVVDEGLLTEAYLEYINYKLISSNTLTYVKTWGIDASYSDLQLQASPGIYSAISTTVQPTDQPLKLDTIKAYLDAGTRAAWARRLVTNINATTKYIEIEYWPLSLPQEYLSQDQFGNYSISNFTDAKWKKYKTYERPHPDNNALFWSDWNNPGYCRQNLLTLGFNPADLTP